MASGARSWVAFPALGNDASPVVALAEARAPKKAPRPIGRSSDQLLYRESYRRPRPGFVESKSRGTKEIVRCAALYCPGLHTLHLARAPSPRVLPLLQLPVKLHPRHLLDRPLLAPLLLHAAVHARVALVHMGAERVARGDGRRRWERVLPPRGRRRRGTHLRADLRARVRDEAGAVQYQQGEQAKGRSATEDGTHQAAELFDLLDDEGPHALDRVLALEPKVEPCRARRLVGGFVPDREVRVEERVLARDALVRVEREQLGDEVERERVGLREERDKGHAGLEGEGADVVLGLWGGVAG